MLNLTHIEKLLKQNTYVSEWQRSNNLIKTRVSKGILYLNDISHMCTKMYTQEYSLQIINNS